MLCHLVAIIKLYRYTTLFSVFQFNFQQDLVAVLTENYNIILRSTDSWRRDNLYYNVSKIVGEKGKKEWLSNRFVYSAICNIQHKGIKCILVINLH